jgi:hypothetical protein
VTDLNRDGFPDVYVLNRGAAILSVVIFDPFSADLVLQTDIVLLSQPSAVAAADVDLDGQEDFAVAYEFGNQIVTGHRVRPDSVAFEAAVGVGTNPRTIAVADFNGDGAPDLMVGNNGSSNVSVLYRNAARDAFQSPLNISVGFSPNDIATGDLNGDGRMDAVIGAEDNVVFLIRNTANTGFDPPVKSAVRSAALSVGVGDLDLDGRLDVVVGHQNGLMSILLNTP